MFHGPVKLSSGDIRNFIVLSSKYRLSLVILRSVVTLVLSFSKYIMIRWFMKIMECPHHHGGISWKAMVVFTRCIVNV